MCKYGDLKTNILPSNMWEMVGILSFIFVCVGVCAKQFMSTNYNLSILEKHL